MPRRRSTKMGKLDVRSKNDVPQFESMLSTGPLTIVLVYADWCGHCTRFKENMWNEVSNMPNKSVNTASLHYDMLDNTSLAGANIEGYPSLLLVGTDKKPADFEAESGVKTNAMPQPANLQELEEIVTMPVTEPVRNANVVAANIVEKNFTTAPTSAPGSTTSLPTSNINQVPRTTYTPAAPATLASPPDILEDLVESQQREIPTSSLSEGVDQKGGSRQRGGQLLNALLAITQQAAPAAAFTAAAMYRSKGKRASGKTRSKRRGSRKTLRRRR